MKKWYLVFMIALFSIGVASAVDGFDDQGNPNDPAVNDRANACFDGGTLDNDRCNTTDADEDGVITQYDIDWMWRCGWFLIRYERGMIPLEAVPEGCKTAPPIQVYFEEAEPEEPECPPLIMESGELGERQVIPEDCCIPIYFVGELGEREIADPCCVVVMPSDIGENIIKPPPCPIAVEV